MITRKSKKARSKDAKRVMLYLPPVEYDRFRNEAEKKGLGVGPYLRYLLCSRRD